MELRVTASAFNDRGPRYMEQVLAALHQGNPQRLPDMLSLIRSGPTVGLACDAPQELQPLVTGQLLAHDPTARVEPHVERPDQLTGKPAAMLTTWSAELALRPEVFPLKHYPQFEDSATRTSADPLTGLLTALAGHERDPLTTSSRTPIHGRSWTRFLTEPACRSIRLITAS